MLYVECPVALEERGHDVPL